MTTRAYATLDASGVLASGQRFTPTTQHAHVHGETFAGDTLTLAFTLAHTPLYGATCFVAGVRVPATVVGAVATLGVAPGLAAVIAFNYEYAP